jgi:uncharacterized protein
MRIYKEARVDRKTLKEVVLEQDEKAKVFTGEGIIRRDAMPESGKASGSNHAVIISGIRRCGKSTLLNAIRDSYGPEGSYGFSFEDERLLDFKPDDFNMLFEIFLELHGGKKAFFLDEIQNVPGWEMFVRRQQDAGYKFFITGSNASLLSREMGTKLTGRNIRVELYPFSFREYLRFAGVEPKDGESEGTKERALLRRHFNEWLKNGGMPEYLKYRDQNMLKHAYEDIIYRDIAARYELKHVKALRELALYFMSNIGGAFTYNSAAKFLGLGSMNTVKNYADYMENSYLVFLVNRFSWSLKKQFVSEKKIYCVDNGLADAVAFKFSSNRGKYLENAVYMELKRRGKEIYYYKTENGLEVDFITRGKKQNVELFQACAEMSHEAARKRELKALDAAMEELKVKKALIITEDEEETMKSGGKTIEVIPAYKWMLRQE